jgi:hypothetical protein
VLDKQLKSRDYIIGPLTVVDFLIGPRLDTGVGDDAGVVAGLVENLGLDEKLPGERVDGGLGTADPLADP